MDKNNNKKKKKQRKGKLLTLRLFAQIQKSVSNCVHFQRGIYRLGSETARSCFQTAEREDTKACHGVQFLPASLLPLQRADLVSSPFLAELGWLQSTLCFYHWLREFGKRHTRLPLLSWWPVSGSYWLSPTVTAARQTQESAAAETPVSQPWAAWLTFSSWEARHLATAPGSKVGWFLFQFLHISEPRFFVDKNFQVLVMWGLSKLTEMKFLKE